MNWWSILSSSWGRTPTSSIAWELPMILITPGWVSYQGDFILAHIELSCPILAHLEGHPSGEQRAPDMTMMTMFDQMTSINVSHQDEDQQSFIKCVNSDKKSIVNIWEEQKQSVRTSVELLVKRTNNWGAVEFQGRELGFDYSIKSWPGPGG